MESLSESERTNMKKEEANLSILNAKEKEYLSAVIKPFRDNCVIKIVKRNSFDKREWIAILLFRENKVLHTLDKISHIYLPSFPEGAMYKGMQPDTMYMLDELGLQEQETTAKSGKELEKEHEN